MAIEFHEDTLCERCRERGERGAKELWLYAGEVSVLKDILSIIAERMEKGQITMSATDVVDFKSLTQSVEEL